MDGRRPEMRRTMTLSEQLAAPPDPAIRDFLKIPQDDALEGGGSPTAPGTDGGGGAVHWKPLRDRLRLRRATNAWQAAAKVGGGPATVPAVETNLSNKYNYSPGEAAAAFSRTYSSRAPSLRATPTFSRVTSTRIGPNSSRSRHPLASAIVYEPHVEDEDRAGEEEHEEEEEAPAAQMSLMALLEQTDSWDDDEEEEEGGGGGAPKNDDEEDDGGREEEMVHVCCVCMVRHKGAAFIPCGHTFCRLCSRELWVSRGNCPLCNGFIQEILDIF